MDGLWKPPNAISKLPKGSFDGRLSISSANWAIANGSMSGMRSRALRARERCGPPIFQRESLTHERCRFVLPDSAAAACGFCGEQAFTTRDDGGSPPPH